MSRFAVAMLVCSDLERSRDFYRDVLNLKIKSSHEPHWIDFDLGNGCSLGLHRRTEFLAVRPGSLQLGFTVDDVDRFVADARLLGVPIFQDPYDDSIGRIAIISDPDGYPVQVVSYTKRRR
ncbi:MAG: VOC family protein [Candidatus Eremiobacteraeota bacterium]|nr:VOC family protein [Candidatus Eremiobacteraeota bacterium]